MLLTVVIVVVLVKLRVSVCVWGESGKGFVSEGVEEEQ